MVTDTGADHSGGAAGMFFRDYHSKIKNGIETGSGRNVPGVSRQGGLKMFTLTMNGKPFDPDDFEKAVREAASNQIKEHLHEQLSSIRNPQTGEFPVVHVTGTSLEDISARVEGSPELLQLVRERLDPEDMERVALVETPSSNGPKAFLRFGWEDRELAKMIAEALQANGIETWWAEWELRAGDSLRQKIDDGLSNCNVFLVLLTPDSIQKPWGQSADGCRSSSKD
jgi:hypothetical protein